MKKALIAAFGVLLLASGCQGNERETAAELASRSPTAAILSLTPSPASLPTPTPVPADSPTPAAAVKLYRLNTNYDVTPIDPDGGAPKQVVLLTFDDGPKKEETLVSLLDTLDRHKAKAIFFVNGYRVKQNPELLKLIYERGQSIGNHSWDHIDLKKESNEKVDQQIGDVQRIVEQLTGEAPRFFRPPNGSGSDYVRERAKAEKLLYMTWSNGSLDWDTKTDNKPQEVIDNVLKQLHAGSNILMHELSWTAEALDKLLLELESRGYGFVDPASIETY